MKLRKNFIGQDGFQWWIGVVEDRNDPEKIGRCRVRIFGIHTDDTVAIPTEDLPWAIPVYSVNNNESFSAPKEGEYVVGFFLDGSFAQSPAILGVLPGINRQTAPDGRGFGDVRDPNKIRNSPRKPSAIDYPEARTGTENPVSGNIINDGIGLIKIIENSITLHVPLSLNAKPSLTENDQSMIGYDHKFTQQELRQGYVSISPLETVPIYGVNGIGTTITPQQAKILLRIDIDNAIIRARNSISDAVWNGLNVAQKAGLAFHAYHIGLNVDFERIGVRSAITSGDFVRAAQLISSDKLKSSTGKYLLSEDSLSHIAANLFKSTPKSLLAQQRRNSSAKRNPVSAAGAGLGVQIHESDLSADSDASSLKYPIPEEQGKPSLNDFATSVEKSLIQKFRERSSIIAIGANDQSWSEPASPYRAEYPYNKAMETESGHVFELDDTPGSERVHLAHRSGSFVEFYPSGTKVEKVVKSNYRIVLNDDYLYVAGKVNIVLESNAHIKVVGDCFLQVENNLEANVSANMNVSVGGAFNMRANTMHFDISNTSTITSNNHYISVDDKLIINSNTSNISTANDFTLYSKSNQYFNVANTIHYRSGNVAIQSSGNISINSVGNGYFTSSNVLHLKGSSTRVTGSSVEVNGLLNAGATNMEATGYDSNGDSHVLSVAGSGGIAALIPDPSLTRMPAIDANGIVYLYHEDKTNKERMRRNRSEEQIVLIEIADRFQINVNQVQEVVNATSYLEKPIKLGTPTDTQKHLEPDRIFRFKDSVTEENNKLLSDYLANPYRYSSPYSNVKRFIAPASTSGSDLIFNDIAGESLIVINDGADISAWLKKQLVLASNGYWRETGVEISGRIEPSNPNITDLWRNLGFSREFWNLSDQSRWAIAFVNFGLKQNGYRYVQTPNPRDLEIRIDDYRFTRVKPSDAQPGDVVLWNNDHANFVYENINGSLTFIGGSQPPYNGNIGDGRIGDVSLVGSGGAQIVAILRPSKT